MSDHVAVGPDGGNLLGFLASVGAFAVLSRVWPSRDVRMSWRQLTGWRPVFHVAGDATDDEVVHALDQGLRGRDVAPEFLRLGDDLPVAAEAFSDFAEAAAADASPNQRLWADFVAAFGCEITVRDRDRIQDTALRTMSGAGHQHFLLFFRRLAECTTLDHVRAALFAPWTYEDDGPSMRWDPVDDRRYAYRADDPSKSRQHPIRTVRGANRLAIESLLCFPTVPRRRQLATTGFVVGRTGGEFVWPIWTAKISLPVFRSIASIEPRRLDPHGYEGFPRRRRRGSIET